MIRRSNGPSLANYNPCPIYSLYDPPPPPPTYDVEIKYYYDLGRRQRIADSKLESLGTPVAKRRRTRQRRSEH